MSAPALRGRRPLLLVALAALAPAWPAEAWAQEGLPLTVEVGHSREILTGGRAEWKESYVRLTYPLGGRDLLWAQLRHTERFSQEDVELSGGGAVALGAGITGQLDGSFSPTGNVLPGWSLGGSLHQAMAGGWGVGVGARHLSYTHAEVDLLSGTVGRAYGPFSTDYTLTLATVDRERSGLTHALRQSYRYGRGSVVTLGAATGRHPTPTGPGEVRLLEALSFALQGVHWLPAGVGITYAVGWAREGDLYERSHVLLGVRSRL